MMDLTTVIALWEDTVGDSGEAPTDAELHMLASAIETVVGEQIARDIRAEAIRLSGLVPDSQLDVLAFISDQYLRIIRGES